MALIPETTGAEKVSKLDAEKTTKLGDHQDDNFAGADTHTTDHPNPKYIEAVKTKLAKGLSGDDQIGDAGKDGSYKGKSMELGQGGRSFMMVDRITLELVTKGYKFEDAMKIAKSQSFKFASKKYGADQMKKWSEPKVTETKVQLTK